jgi:hypothetical protein
MAARSTGAAAAHGKEAARNEGACRQRVAQHPGSPE